MKGWEGLGLGCWEAQRDVDHVPHHGHPLTALLQLVPTGAQHSNAARINNMFQGFGNTVSNSNAQRKRLPNAPRVLCLALLACQTVCSLCCKHRHGPATRQETAYESPCTVHHCISVLAACVDTSAKRMSFRNACEQLLAADNCTWATDGQAVCRLSSKRLGN